MKTSFNSSGVPQRLSDSQDTLFMRLGSWLKDFRPRSATGIPPIGSDADLKNRFCPTPFEHFELLSDGTVSQCCPDWLPHRAGKFNSGSGDDVWNSKQAQAIRVSILDGSFSSCDRTLCPKIQAGNLPTIEQAKENPAYRAIIDGKKTFIEGIPLFLNLCHDRSCNLSCPSCRCEKINYVRGEDYDRAKELQDKLVATYLSEPSEQAFTLSITGSGDPFGSRVFREFLCDFDGAKFPNMKINLQTNGVLFTAKQWQRLHKIHDKIHLVLVSFDAATEPTYNITRRGGQWNLLLSNMEMIGQLRRDDRIKYLRVDFVVQDVNFLEMEAFVGLAKSFSADGVYFARAVQWGAWTEDEYRQKCVWERDHHDYAEFMEMISRPVFADPIVDLGNLSEFRRIDR
jgi:sulfatase maturation enzyme AslB (radical SAM superfamily)